MEKIDAKISNALGITTGNITEQILEPKKPIIPRPPDNFEDAKTFDPVSGTDKE